jgi:3-hydroxybutyryl-CoA dehydrogenase
MPYLNEAIIALETGVASKEDIDQTMKLGMNHPSSSFSFPRYLLSSHK